MQKLAPPVSLQSQLQRARLEEEIERGGDAGFVLVQAPAGFGKTTLLAQVHARLAAAGIPAGWLGLDAADNDVGRFARYLAAALGRAQAGIAEAEPDSGDDGIGFAYDLIGRIGAAARPFRLFLDDLDVIQNPSVLDMLKRLLQFMPHGSMVFAGARRIPDLGIARLRAQGRMVEIGQAALRFSLAETAGLLRDKRRLPLDDEDIRRLMQCTEGWITALQLGAMSLEKRHDVKGFVTAFSGSHTDVTDYFAEVVLSGEDASLREFLMQTSVLNPMCASLCDAVTGRTDSREILARLEKRNLFLVPLDDERRWYRYHSLFAGFLQHQLDMRDPAARESLHRRACDWYRDNDRPIPAIDHALAAGAYDVAIPLLEAHARQLLREGRVRMLSRWIEALPPDAAWHTAEQSIVYAWAFTLARRYQDAARLLDAMPEADAAAAGNQVAALRAFIQVVTDRAEEQSLARAQTVLESLDSFTCGLVTNSLAYARIGLSDYRGAREVLNHARSTHAALKDNYTAVIFECNECIADMLQGHLMNAAARLRSLYVRAGASGRSSVGAALACALIESGALPEAEKLLVQCLPFIADGGTPDSIIASHLALTRIACARNELAEALQHLSNMEYMGHRLELPRMVATVWLERSRIALLRQDFAGARTYLENADDAAVWRHYRQFAMYANDVDTLAIGRARLAARTGDAEAALSIIAEELALAEKTKRRRRMLKLNILRAEALHAAGRKGESERALRLALHEAAADGQVRIFADEGMAIGRLIEECSVDALAGVPQDFIGRIQRAIQDGIRAEGLPDEEDLADGGVPRTEEQILEPLTEREIEVLRLLAEGHPNRLLAEKLFVSETTIKAHLRHINSKLNARNRTDAVNIGRRAGLI